MSFHRVITAFDGSEQGADALALALRLLDPNGALTLACVVTAQRWHLGAHVHRPDAAVPDELTARFADARADMIPPGIRVRERAPVAPSPARGLTELAESERADLIVIGSSRHASDGRIRLERTAGRLLQGAPCAVAITPGGLRETTDFRHIGIAYDGSPEARTALAVGYDIAARCGAAVTLLYALSAIDPEELRMEAGRHARVELDAAAETAPAGVNPRTVLLHGTPSEVIRAACDGVVGLLVTGSRGYGPMHRALVGSVSEALTEGATHPVLIVPRQPTPLADKMPSPPQTVETP
jgi:nucleotide-binding universal stress UspA family protein